MDSRAFLMGFGFIAFGAWVGLLQLLAPKIRREATEALKRRRSGQETNYTEPPKPPKQREEPEVFRPWQSSHGQQGAVYMRERRHDYQRWKT